MSDDDPRDRPPDPAGTQPKVDPASLVPTRRHELTPATPSAAEPEPAAEAVETSGDADERLLPERLAHARVPGAVGDRVEAPHARRFHALSGALVGLGLACMAGVILFLAVGDTSRKEAAPWSSWQPSGDLARASDQIARHVGPRYHRTTADQLALVSGGPPTIQGAGLDGGSLPLDIVLRDAQDGSYAEARGTTVLYRLCGLGEGCAIAGSPSAERWLLVRREALELALYSFHYIHDLDHVVVMLPPTVPADSASADPTATAEGTERALFFRRADLREQLRRPLPETLPGTAPLPNKVKRSRGAQTVERATASRLFSYGLQPSNSDNSAFLILEAA